MWVENTWPSPTESRRRSKRLPLPPAYVSSLTPPGVGHFTILDGEDVKPEDQGSNFFVGPGHVGRSRAEVGSIPGVEETGMRSDARGAREPELFLIR